MTDFGATKAEIIEAIHAGANRADLARLEGAVWRLFDRVNAMPQRLSPDLIAQLTALASRLTQMGEYEACDLIDTVVARVSAMPGRELLAEALEALDVFGRKADDYDDVDVAFFGAVPISDLRRARAAADKIRAALEHKQKEDAK